MSTWVDDSLIQSELVGILLLLSLLWILVLKNQLWKIWLREHYLGIAEELSQELGLSVVEDWKPRLILVGRTGQHELRVQWIAGVGPHRVTVMVGRRFKRRRWRGAPNTSAGEIARQARRLLGLMQQ